MLFAAGRGVRMGPLTRAAAKPALPFCGTPLITRILGRLRSAGIRDIVVNLHYLPMSLHPLLDAFEADLTPGCSLRRSVESDLLGTSGGLHRAVTETGGPAFGEGPLFVLNGDTLATVDLGEMAAFHRQAGGEATLLCDADPGPEFARERRIETDPEGRITGLSAPGGPGYGFSGVWLLEPSALRHLSGKPVGLSTDLLPALIRAGSGRAFPVRAPWFEIGSPRRYLTASLRALASGAVKPIRPPGIHFGIGASASPASLVSPGCELREGARAERSILLPGVRVGDGAVVRGSVVAEGETVPSGARIRDALFADGALTPLS